MPCKTAAIKRVSSISKRHMQRVANEIVDQHGMAGHAQGFVRELNNLSRFEMMHKQTGADHIETICFEGKGEGIARNHRIAAIAG